MAITSKDNRWIKTAKKLQEYSKDDRYLMSAILVHGGKLLSYGVNSKGPAAFFARFPSDRQKHAEVNCLLWLDKEVTKGCTMYVSGRSCANSTILSKPCKFCFDIIKAHGIRRIVYHDRSGELIEEKC